MAAPPRLALLVVLACAGGVPLACGKGQGRTPSAPAAGGAEGRPAATGAAAEAGWLQLDDAALLARLAALHPFPQPDDWPGLGDATDARRRRQQREAELLAVLEPLLADPAAARTGLAAESALALAELYTDEGVGEYERGARCAVFALAARPESGPAWRVLGVNRARVGAAEQALACLRRAAELLPADPVSRRESALLRAERGEHDAAETLFEQALELDGADRVARYGLAALYEEQGDLDAARTHLERLLADGWEHPSPLFRLARVLEGLGQDDAAAAIRRRHERATILDDLRLDQSSPPLRKHAALGAWYLDHGRPEDALPEYEAALPLARGADVASLLAGLADCCGRLGRAAEGRRHLERLRELDPAHPLLAYLEELLAP